MERMQITREELAEVIENVMNTPSEGKESFAELCTVATMTAIHLNDYLRFATQYPFTSEAVIAGLRVAANIMEENFSAFDEDPEQYKEHVAMTVEQSCDFLAKEVVAVTIPVIDMKGGTKHEEA
jgi:hypothetical protein